MKLDSNFFSFLFTSDQIARFISRGQRQVMCVTFMLFFVKNSDFVCFCLSFFCFKNHFVTGCDVTKGCPPKMAVKIVEGFGPEKTLRSHIAANFPGSFDSSKLYFCLLKQPLTWIFVVRQS